MSCIVFSPSRSSLWVVAMIAAAALVLLPGSSASAHAQFLGSTPDANQTVATPPAAIELRFNEPVSPLPDAAAILDDDGTEVAIDVITEGATILITPSAPLSEGTHLVRWGIISADDHPIRGSFVFHVGEPSTDVGFDVGATETPTWIDAGHMAVHGVGLAAVMLAAGLVVFLLVLHDGQPGEQRTMRRIALLSSLVALVHVPLGLAFQAATITAGSSGFTNGDAWDAAFQSRTGDQSVAVAIGAVVLIAGLLLWRMRPLQFVALAGGALAVAAFSWAGHTATIEPRWFGYTSNIVHMAAGACWIGGLAGLATVLRARRGEKRPSAGAIARRFSRLALVTVVVVIVMGVILACLQLDDWRELYNERYGQLLVAKVLVVLAVLGLAYYNRGWLIRRVTSTSASYPPLLRNVGLELLGIVLIIGLTAVLSDQSPHVEAEHDHGSSGRLEPMSAVAREGFMGDQYHVVATFAPGPDGSQAIQIIFHTLGAADPADIRDVSLQLSHEKTGDAPLVIDLEPMAPGVYRYEATEFVFPGDWDVTIVARISDFEQETLEFTVPIE